MRSVSDSIEQNRISYAQLTFIPKNYL